MAIGVNPKMITWARERTGIDLPTFSKRFPRLPQWESGESQPTFYQLEKFAWATRVPITDLLRPEPPRKPLPIPDFRMQNRSDATYPNPNLLDTILLCQEKHDWLCGAARSFGLDVLGFVGSATIEDPPEHVAQAMRQTLSFGMEEQQKLPSWKDVFYVLIKKIEDKRLIIVMISSVVGNDKHRKLSVDEFRGFVLVDGWMPLIFINGADHEAGQMFTLAHELAHLWLGESGVSNPEAGKVPELPIERWRNAVAAEFLMPMAVLRQCYRGDMPIMDEAQQLARQFNVCTPVILRRLFDAGFIDESTLWQNYQEEVAHIRAIEQDNRKFRRRKHNNNIVRREFG